jgi:CheY-like chemotaxis protein
MNLNVVGDGEEALAFLRQEGRFGEALRPALVLLDLNMPKKDGYEVLLEMRQDPELECIPVVIFTSSEAKEDILRCYRSRANAYVSKPTYVEQFTNAVKLIEEFWFRVAQLPPQGGGRKLTL